MVPNVPAEGSASHQFNSILTYSTSGPAIYLSSFWLPAERAVWLVGDNRGSSPCSHAPPLFPCFPSVALYAIRIRTVL